MATEVFEIAIAQALEELQALKKSTAEQNQLIKKLIDKIEKSEEGYQQQGAVIDQQSFPHLMQMFRDEVKRFINTQPKSAVRQIRILLFPEQNASEYYRLVFGRLIFWMMIFLISTYLFVLAQNCIKNWRTLKEKQLEQTGYKNAWEYLYQHESKQGERNMEKAWQKANGR